MKKLKMITLTLTLVLAGCKNDKTQNMDNENVSEETVLEVTSQMFGKMPNETEITSYTLSNQNGMKVDIITYGGRITQIGVPDRNGKIENVTLGFDNLEDYLAENPFFGALIGRYGNRIAQGKFNLEGTTYSLATNNGENHLHGGIIGFDQVVWNAVPKEGKDKSELVLTYLSEDGEEGYPGNLNVTVTYSLNNKNELTVEYSAITDAATVFNPTQHAYFNLTGDFSKDILNHEVYINADYYLPVDEGLIPTGELKNVEGTPFDFKSAKKVGKDISEGNEQLQRGGGYDHCWVLNGKTDELRLVATAYDNESGRLMEVLSTEPAIQFYTGNFLDGSLKNPAGGTYGHRSGFCLETQHYPDSPNHPNFPSTVLRPGETFQSKTTYRFSAKP